jgi:hypothetical protein
MGSSRRYFEYARECSRCAAEAEERSTQDLLFEMAKAWTNIALVESDVAKQAAVERFVTKRSCGFSSGFRCSVGQRRRLVEALYFHAG